MPVIWHLKYVRNGSFFYHQMDIGLMDVKADRWSVLQTLGDRKTLGTDKSLPKETLIQLKIECHYVDLLLNLPVGSRMLPTSSADVNSIWGRDTAASQHKAPWNVKFLLLSIPGAEKPLLACCPWRTAGLLCPCLWAQEMWQREHCQNQRSFSPILLPRGWVLLL